MLLVRAKNLVTTGSYNMNTECLFPTQSPDTVVMTYGMLAHGKIGAPAQVDLYAFNGAAGDLISLALASAGGFSTNPASGASVQLTLYAASGSVIGTVRSNSQASGKDTDTESASDAAAIAMGSLANRRR